MQSNSRVCLTLERYTGKGLRNGAFQPFTEQLLLRASLLLFGAIGITAGEYLTVFN